MKAKLAFILTGLLAMTLLSGCVVAFSLGGGKKDASRTTTTSNSSTNNAQHPAVVQQTVEPTIGQQLLDLKKARDAGAISESEYQAEKAKLLGQK